MKKISQISIIIIISLVILGLTLPLLKINAQENLQAPLKEAANKIDELLELKDNDTLSEKEREDQEIKVRKEALEKIIEVTLLEVGNLQGKLNSLELGEKNKDLIQIKEKFWELLENNKNYALDLQEKNKKEDLSLEDTKKLAQEFKDWREENYNKFIKKITVFTLVFQEKQVLNTANIRLDKIVIDLKKLENAKILKKEDTSNLLNSAMKSLINAQTFNSSAEEIIVKITKRDIINATTTASTTLEIMENLIATTTSEISFPMATSTMATSTIATTTPAKIIETEEDRAQKLIEKSLTEIKNAYNNFMSISAKVKLKLKIK